MIGATLDEYKAFAGITGVKDNPQITALLASSELLVEGYIGITYGVPTADEAIVTTGGRVQYYPVTMENIDSISFYSRNAGTNIELVLNTDYLVRADSLTLLTVTPSDNDVITVDYTDTARSAAPDDVKFAVLLLTQYYHKQEYSRSGTTGSNGAALTVSTRESTSLPNRVRTILDFHRIL